MKTGQTGTAATVVAATNTALAVKSGMLPVFSTPMMVALMEEAACNALQNDLEEGHTTVGTDIDVAHVAASPMGAKITATAEVTSVEGRKITFAVTACDDKHEIGAGTHTRVIIDTERFMARLG
ncbi:MAG: thioesterase family protein [Defluviitaleaceae bacterium]|nr:thioesterase family protein [Defluviitaleaceae bacterium]MCL2275093.1 thioesterase family protein [Defluviitaleaceae bacterium]